MTTPLTRTEFWTIVEPIEAVPGKYGPQFKFKASVPWTQWPATFYVSQNLMPQADTPASREALLNTGHWASFKRGSLMKNEDGTTKDPELEWSYRWDVIGWDVPAEAATSGGGSSRGGGGGGSDRNRSIERQVAFKGAIDLVLGQVIELADVTYYTDIFAGAIADDYLTSAELGADPEPAAPGHLVETARAYGAVVIEETPASPPPCATHGGAVFEYKTGRTGASKWTHQKSDGGWCIFDGEMPAAPAPETAELPF